MAEDTRVVKKRLLMRIFATCLLLQVSTCSGNDAEALLAIKQRLNSPAVLANWSGSNPCNWTGVQCSGTDESADRRVMSLSLPKSSLTGTLDSAIGDLTAIQVINLTQNFLSGQIPSELQLCVGLRSLDLSQNSFVGNISGLFSLKNLVELNLAGNMITGSLPPTVGILNRLQVLNLSYNENFFGEIPSEIGSCKSLQKLDFSRGRFCRNYNHSSIVGLTGVIPAALGNCTSLQSLDFSCNSLSGRIPPSLFHLRELETLSLEGNNLSGTLYQMESTAAKLKHLILKENQFTGKIPGFVFNLTNLVTLVLSGNNFTGAIPSSVGNLTKLEKLALSRNSLHGVIPGEIGRLSVLRTLSIHRNELEGPIPQELVSCKDLRILFMQENLLSSSIPSEISNLTNLQRLILRGNELAGVIPAEIANCSNLLEIDFGLNRISGNLPEGLHLLPNLSRIFLDYNELSGKIPHEYSTMLRLEYLVLSYNRLTGRVPNNFSSTSSLLNLELAHNQLSGSVPHSLRMAFCLQTIDVSMNQLSGNFSPFSGGPYRVKPRSLQLQHVVMNDNHLTGELPTDWAALPSLLTFDVHGNQIEGPLPVRMGDFQLTRLDLSSNGFSGSIPATMGLPTFLNYLNLSYNRITGKIPPALGTSWDTERASTVVVDLSNNDLSGEIPKELNLQNLEINVSNNRLSGCIPQKLQNLSAAAFLGNYELSGAPLPNKDCVQTRSAKQLTAGRLLAIVFISVVLVTSILVASLLCFCRRSRFGIVQHWRRGAQVGGIEISGTTSVQVGWFGDIDTCFSEEPGFSNKSPKLNPTYSDLSRATEGFSSQRIIGDGGFGIVYRGELRDGTVVAVKKFTEDGCQGEREFFAELQTLGSIRHKNLVRLLGGCLYSTERLLVYEFMPNNSLEAWLYSRTDGMEPLPWEVRITIARDIARGLTFLHHFCVPKVIHRDLKSSNILLDSVFNAKLADFGLARHLNTYESHMSTQVAGSLGYIAPEYAQSWRATTKGDVFSFGVVMLELLSGKRPAGECCYKPTHGGNILGWIRYLFRTSQIKTLFFDETLGSIQNSDVESDLMAVLDIALRCTHDDPARRPAMLDVLRSLEDQRSDSSTKEPSHGLVIP